MQTEVSAKDPVKIQGMFSQVAENYDRANTVLSMGIHHLWRTQLVNWAGLEHEEKILDCATGTGDLALKMKRLSPSSEVVGSDFCQPMLDKAREKDPANEVHFQWADAMSLPFPTQSFDLVTISFGIRNVEDPVVAMTEMFRVLKPGGRLLVLEFGQPRLRVFERIYNFYSNNVLPRIGGWVTGQRSAYQYLQSSSAAFPCADGFLKLMKKAGPWKTLEYKTLTGGIAYIYKAEKSE
jgi:demethylmenaquinone methyltransferase/2-methoxy-6-polyprenyl-1,4-benzoquinol methylase